MSADSRHLAGSLIAVDPDREALLDDEPFARLLPVRRLHVGPGLIGAVPAPVGPSLERYASDAPWPWDRFA